MATYNGFKSIESKEFFERKLLHDILENNIMLQFAVKATLPKQHGDTISWRKRMPIPVQKDSDGKVRRLIEGVTPTSNKMEFVEYSAKIAEFGDYIRLTKKLSNLAYDPVIYEGVEGMGESAGESMDLVVFEKIYSNPNVVFPNNKTATTITSADTFKLSDLHKIKAYFQKRKVKPFANGKYVLVINPDVEYDLKKDESSKSSWIDINQYSGAEKIAKGEIGSIFGFKVIVSNNIQTETIEYTPTGASAKTTVLVNKCVAFGKDPYGSVELEGESAARPKVWVNRPGTQGYDPLHQRQSIAWKCEGFTVRIFNPANICTIKAPSSLDYSGDIAESSNPDYVRTAAGTVNKYQTFDDNKGIAGDDSGAEIVE